MFDQTISYYKTASNGLLNPPFLFMYCLYFLFTRTCTSPWTLSSTFCKQIVTSHVSWNWITFLILCCVESTEPHNFHHFDLLLRFPLKVLLSEHWSGSRWRCTTTSLTTTTSSSVTVAWSVPLPPFSSVSGVITVPPPPIISFSHPFPGPGPAPWSPPPRWSRPTSSHYRVICLV